MTTNPPALTFPHAIFATPAISILLPIGLGTGVGLSVPSTKKTYAAIKQPPLSPPALVFPPVWTALYGLMGYAAYRAFTIGTAPWATPSMVKAAHDGVKVYSTQLALNLAWMPLFFGARAPRAATADLALLMGANALLTWQWSRIDAVAAWCQAPYLVWLSFAAYLSAATGHLNGWDLENKSREKSS